MAVARVQVMAVVAMVAVLLSVVAPGVCGQSPTPVPAPTSDGTSIDLEIAYGLMFAALALTYLIHPMDASSFGFF